VKAELEAAFGWGWGQLRGALDTRHSMRMAAAAFPNLVLQLEGWRAGGLESI
jgi:hypothetical protein